MSCVIYIISFVSIRRIRRTNSRKQSSLPSSLLLTTCLTIRLRDEASIFTFLIQFYDWINRHPQSNSTSSKFQAPPTQEVVQCNHERRTYFELYCLNKYLKINHLKSGQEHRISFIRCYLCDDDFRAREAVNRRPTRFTLRRESWNTSPPFDYL